MIYRKLFDWIDGDDACEVTSITLYSAHDPGYLNEREFIVSRVKSLIETGVTIQGITLKIWLNEHHQEEYLMQIPSNYLHDIDLFTKLIEDKYDSGESIETMIIKVSIKENGH